MNDFKSIEATYSAYVETQGEANNRNKTRVLDALAASGITSVTISFDGEGDNGQIEELLAYIEDNQVAMPETRISFEAVLWGSSVWQQTEEIPLSNAIENLCYGYLAQLYGGWENNDGAFGDFRIEVAEGKIKFEFNGRYTNYSTSTHTL